MASKTFVGTVTTNTATQDRTLIKMLGGGGGGGGSTF